jgi:hypothetical protein
MNDIGIHKDDDNGVVGNTSAAAAAAAAAAQVVPTQVWSNKQYCHHPHQNEHDMQIITRLARGRIHVQ